MQISKIRVRTQLVFLASIADVCISFPFHNISIHLVSLWSPSNIQSITTNEADEAQNKKSKYFCDYSFES